MLYYIHIKKWHHFYVWDWSFAVKIAFPLLRASHIKPLSNLSYAHTHNLGMVLTDKKLLDEVSSGNGVTKAFGADN